MSLLWLIILFATLLANLEDGFKRVSYPAHTSPALPMPSQLGLPPVSNSLSEAGTKSNLEPGEIWISIPGVPAMNASAHPEASHARGAFVLIASEHP